MKNSLAKKLVPLSVLGMAVAAAANLSMPVMAEGGGVAQSPVNPAVSRDKAVKPNVVYIVLDDMGFSDFGCYGSEIKTPNIDKLAANGIRYNNFSVCPVCSPTRASLLTGRNNHAVGMGELADMDFGAPNFRGRITDKAATVAQILKANNYSTLAVGKWHVAPVHQITPAGPFDYWPLAKGFERYYGYLNGETDQCDPLLTYDNQMLATPAGKGYQLSGDLVDMAKQFVTDQVSIAPNKPFFLYLAFGAVHSPHQAPKEYINMYNGVYDKGWDKIREERFERQKKLGIIPANTELTPRDSSVKPWDSLTADEKKLYARFEQAYAGFLTYTDAQIGRMTDYLKAIGRFDNTMIVLISDNGATCYGGDEGSDYFPALNGKKGDGTTPVSHVEDYLKRIDEIGGPEFGGLYQRGWAMVSNTPFKGYKGSAYAGGTRVPLVIHWPMGVKTGGQIRSQAVSVIDITPTVLDVLNISAPATFQGIEQMPMHGQSIAASFNDGKNFVQHNMQFTLYQNNRSITKDGWKAIASAQEAWSVKNKWGKPSEQDKWELYHLNDDYAEVHDVAAQYPDKLKELKDLWQETANQYGIELPAKFGKTDAVNNRNTFKYLPGTNLLGPAAGPKIGNRSFAITVPVERANKSQEGVLVACGGEFSGYTFYIKGNRLVFEYNYFGSVTKIESQQPVPVGAAVLKFALKKTSSRTGVGELYIDGKLVGEAKIPATFGNGLGDEGMSIGYDSHTPVSHAYKGKDGFRFTGQFEYVLFELQNDQKDEKK